MNENEQAHWLNDFMNNSQSINSFAILFHLLIGIRLEGSKQLGLRRRQVKAVRPARWPSICREACYAAKSRQLGLSPHPSLAIGSMKTWWASSAER